jgi:glycosyltransferase involved in cell wall biosynthesis
MPSKRRILIVGPRLDVFGGVSGFYNSIFPSLKAANDANIRYLGVGEKPGVIGKFKFISSLYDILCFIKCLVVFRPHLIHFNPSLSPFALIRDSVFIFIAKLVSRPKILVFFRGWNKSNERFVEKYSPLFNRSLLKANYYITLSDHSKATLVHWGVPEENIELGKTVIDEGIFTYLEEQVRHKDSTFNEKKINVIILTRLVKEKGLYELIDGFSAVLKEQPDWTLTVAGDGPELEGLKLKAQELCISNSVHFLGYISGKEKYNALTQAQIFCLPSYSEGMPNSVLEAFAVGHAVLATPVGALENFCTLDWVIPLQLKSAASITDALLDKKLLQELPFISQRNKNIAKTQFRVEHIVNDLNDTYLKILKK